MRTAAAAAAVAVALSLTLGATVALAASPVPGTLGLQLSPAPLHVDAGERTLTATNRSGGLALHVELTASGGYTVAPASFDLAPDASQAVTVTGVNASEDGTLSAVATSVVTGTITSQIALNTRFVHLTWLEAHPAVLPVGSLLILLLFALWGLAIYRRRRTTWT